MAPDAVAGADGEAVAASHKANAVVEKAAKVVEEAANTVNEKVLEDAEVVTVAEATMNLFANLFLNLKLCLEPSSNLSDAISCDSQHNCNNGRERLTHPLAAATVMTHCLYIDQLGDAVTFDLYIVRKYSSHYLLHCL